MNYSKQTLVKHLDISEQMSEETTKETTEEVNTIPYNDIGSNLEPSNIYKKTVVEQPQKNRQNWSMEISGGASMLPPTPLERETKRAEQVKIKLSGDIECLF